MVLRTQTAMMRSPTFLMRHALQQAFPFLSFSQQAEFAALLHNH
jgi:hypothetical protein